MNLKETQSPNSQLVIAPVSTYCEHFITFLQLKLLKPVLSWDQLLCNDICWSRLTYHIHINPKTNVNMVFPCAVYLLHPATINILQLTLLYLQQPSPVYPPQPTPSSPPTSNIQLPLLTHMMPTCHSPHA